MSEIDSSSDEAADRETPTSGYMTRASMFDRLRTSEPNAREEVWEQFVARYSPVIAGFAKRCGASRQDVDDIVQDVIAGFLGVSAEFAYDPTKGRFRGWLKTVTVRSALRRAGKNLKFRGLPLSQIGDTDAAVDQVWDDLWEQQLVARALQELRASGGETAGFRAFEQYVLLDRPPGEVAKELGVSVDTVHQAKTRMTKRLREIVATLRETD